MTRTIWALALAAVLVGGAGQGAAAAESPVTADPPQDTAHPARLDAVQIPSGGASMNGRVFVASGAGPHPTVLLLHGFPGNEQNFDLAQSIRRAGWNVVTFHYRGSWGSGGAFSLRHAIEDVDAALAWLRTPAAAQAHGIDPTRIVVAGHSMGGFLGVMSARDAQVRGFVLISSWDVAAEAPTFADPAKRAVAAPEFAENLPPLAGTSVDRLADEIVREAPAWGLAENAGRIAARPLLVIGSNDGGEPANDLIVAAATRAGGKPARIHIDTDHSFNDRRIALQEAIVSWLRSAL